MQFTLFYNKAGCIELKAAAAIHSFKRTGLEEKKGVKSKMAKDKMYGKTLRKNFARHEEIMEMPNLLALQKKSYQWFLDTGLREVFSDVASISNYAGNLELSFIDYKMDEAPKYDVLECKARDATYAAPLKVSVRLYNKETGEIKEQEIFMGDFPLMTDSGTFVINGAERVVVSQLVRSPGIYYGKEIDLKTDLPLLTSTVIPYRGAWLEYETDANEMFWVRIDKNRKLPITELIRAIGFKTDAEILELFGDDDRVTATLEKDACKTYEEAMLEIYRKLRPGEPPTADSARSLLEGLLFNPQRYDLARVGRYKVNKKLGIDVEDNVKVLNIENSENGNLRNSMLPTLLIDASENKDFADKYGIFEIGRVVDGLDENGICKERKRLGVVLYDKSGDEKALYFKAVEIINCLVGEIKQAKVVYNKIAPEHNWQHPKNTAEITVGGKRVGVLCALHPANRAKLDKVAAAVCFEIDMNDFHAVKANPIMFREPSTQQSTYYDLSLVLAGNTKYSDIESCWQSLGIKELESAKVIDTYEKLGIKSITVRLVFAAMDRTLEMDEVQSWIDSILANLDKIGVVLRA